MEKTHLTADSFNWQRDADKRIGCQTVSLDQLNSSFFSSLEEKVLQKIGYPGGVDGYLVRVQVDEEELSTAEKLASLNSSPYIITHIICKGGEEYWGHGGERLKIQDPANYIVSQNIYFNLPPIFQLNQTKPPKEHRLKEAISYLIDPQTTTKSPFLEEVLGEYLEEPLDLEKLQDLFPALFWMKKRIKDSRQGLGFLPFIKSFLRIPYGLPFHTTYLFLALIIRDFAQSLWCRPDPKALGERLITDVHFFFRLVQGHEPRAILYLRPPTPREEEYSKAINVLFYGLEGDLTTSYRSLNSWYRCLPTISKGISLYSGEISLFVKALKYLSPLSYSIFLQKELPSIFPQVEKGLKKAKEQIEKTPQRIRQQIKIEVQELFPQGIWEWYQGLNDYQLSVTSLWQDQITLSLLTAIEEGKGEFSFFLDIFLNSLKLGTVEEWEKDERERFFLLLKRAKGKIGEFKTAIPKPIFHFCGEEGKDNNYYFQNSFTLTIEPPKGLTTMITFNGEDPRCQLGNRKVIKGPFQYKGEGDHCIRMVSCRGGYYGEPLDLVLKDTLGDYTIKVEEDLFTTTGAKEPRASFILTQKVEGIKCTLRSLLLNYIKRGVSKTTLENLALEVLESIPTEEKNA